MSPISLLLLLPLTVSSLPVSLYGQGESLKDILRLLDRNPTYGDALRRAGAGANRCIDDIDDAIDDAIGGDLPRQVQKPNSKLQQEQVCQQP